MTEKTPATVTQVEMIGGTETKASYAVVASTEVFKLALKMEPVLIPVNEETMHLRAIRMRIRMVSADPNSIAPLQKKWVRHMPDTEAYKVESKRVSGYTVFQMLEDVPVSMSSDKGPIELAHVLTKYIPKAYAKFKGLVKNIEVIDCGEALIQAYLNFFELGKLVPAVEQIAHAPTQEPESEKPKVAKVLEFKANKDEAEETEE